MGPISVSFGDVGKSFGAVGSWTLFRSCTAACLVSCFVFFRYHAAVSLRVKLADVLKGTWDEGWQDPQGMLLVYGVSCCAFVPWCRYLESVDGVRPQLYANDH